MCGIAGFALRAPVHDARERLRAMTDVIRHRGPDDEGALLTRTRDGAWEIGLGHRRLAIIDPNGSRQPMASADGRLQLIFNGEIYNYQSLRAALERAGHRFLTNGDTETILASYAEYGDDCVNHLEGQFAFALWDGGAERLLFARDRFGEKPLFFAERPEGLRFGSEIKALLSDPALDPRLDLEAVLLFLQFRYVPGPGTMYQGIVKLPPGCLAVWERGRLSTRRYWRAPDAQAHDGSPAPADPYGRFLTLFDGAVQRMMVADVPYGAFLSGGLDSSSVVALMATHTSSPVETFSVGFREEEYSELTYAEQVAKAIGTHHHPLVVSHQQVIDGLGLAAWHRDAPVSEPADVCIHLLSVEAGKTVKMVLSGEGSDEILAGYPKHSAERATALLQRVPAPLRQGLLSPLTRALPYRAKRLKTALYAMNLDDTDQRMARWFGALDSDEIRALTGREPPPLRGEARQPLSPDPGVSALRRILYFDQTSWLPDNLLERGDRMSMAASIELRVPFLDPTLVRYVASLPDHLRIHGLESKHLLRRTMRGRVPEIVLKRPKAGFSMPVNVWLRSGMRPLLVDLVLNPNGRLAPLFERAILERLVREHTDGSQNHEKTLWMLLNLNLWAERQRVTL